MKLHHLFCIVLLTINIANANIIRDSEIEEAIELIIEPIKKTSGLKDLKIYIVEDLVPNAFTIGGNIVFISSGLIIDFPDPDILRGVVAHEIGHILGHHIVRRQEVIENYSKMYLAGTILGLATLVARNDVSGLAVMMGGAHFSERSVLAYSRTFESSADQIAMKLLEKSSHSVIGLIEFFKKTKKLYTLGGINIYDQTHPISSERLAAINDFHKKSKFQTSQNSAAVINKYLRSAAKLAAFTLDINKKIDHKFVDNTGHISSYIKSIKHFRMGNFNEAQKNIDYLLSLNPQDPYYHELKGQINFEHGKEKAINEYKKARTLRPNDVLIRLGYAIVGMSSVKDPASLNLYSEELLFVLDKEPDNLLALYYMAIYYDKVNLKGKGYLNNAIISLNTGRLEEAKKMAKNAMKTLPKNSPDWYKAGDILAASE